MVASPSRDLAHFAGLEDKFCKDFSCCGATLENLHDLLQHFEECHVRVESDIEEDEDLPFEFESMDDMDTDMSDDSSPANAPVTFTDIFLKSQLQQQQPAQAIALSDIYSEANKTAAAFDQRRRMQNNQPNRIKKVKPMASEVALGYDASGDIEMEDASSSTRVQPQLNPATIPTPLPAPVQPLHTPLLNTTTALPLATPTPAPAVFPPNPAAAPLPAGFDPALAAGVPDLNMDGVVLVDEAGGVSSSSRDDRPYKCKVTGCYKAYKNPGGLKYHMQHGHCEDTGDPEMNNIIHKPYQCTVPECGKRYKNLNGLKVCTL